MLQLHKKSGSARTVDENIAYFLSKGFEVHVVSMGFDDSLKQNKKIHLHRTLPWLKSTGLFRRKWYDLQVKSLAKKIKPTIILGHGDIFSQDVVTLHNCVFLASELIHGKPLDPQHEMAQTHGKILREKTFKKLIANSELMKSDCVKRFGLDSQSIHVIYPAVNTKVFYPKPEEKTKLRERFSFREKIIVSLVTSGNFKKRGLDLFVRAIALLEPEVQAMTSFRVVGKDDHGEYKNSPVIFDPGLKDIENYYNAIDLFVLPARIEEFGRVVLEAMATGLPVITTDTVGAAELLEGESREFVLPHGNVEALAAALKKMILNPDLRVRLGRLNAESAQKEREELVFEKFDRVFGSLIENQTLTKDQRE